MSVFWSALVNGALLATVLTVIVAFALRVASRQTINAATRYAIWWVVLAATLALPLACMQWTSAEPAPARLPESPALDFGPIRTSLVPLAAAPISATAPVSYGMSLPVQIRTSQWLQPLLNVWIACSLLLLTRLVVSYAVLYRRSSRASDAPPEWSARVKRWTTRKDVRLALSDEIGIPIATGPYRPAILIPRNLAEQISDEDMEQIGLHEATHLARRDDWMLCLQRVIEALFALHPLVRWITRQIDLEREIACDDVVAGSAHGARRYADCLTRMVELCGGVQAPLAAAGVTESRSHLSRRVAVLLDGSRVIRPRLHRGRSVAIAATLVCITGVLVKTPKLIAFETPSAPAQIASPISTPHEVEQMVVPKPAAPRHPLVIAQTAPAPIPPPQARPEFPRYVLGANDVVSVAMTGQDAVSGTYTIGPDGRMSMPLIGDLDAAGLTIPDLRQRITQSFTPYLGKPEVNVQLLRNNSKKYVLIGGMTKTGPYPLLQKTTVLDALAAAGEFKDLANPKKIVVRRGAEEFHFSYKDVIAGKRLEQNIELQDGDIIIVPLQ